MTPARALFYACVFESGLLLVAYAIGWVAGVDPLSAVNDDLRAAGTGLLAVLPMLVLLWWGLRHPHGAMGRATVQARDFVHQFFDGIGPGGFALVALLAGLCEEALFRGLVQTVVAQHSNVLTGLIIASVLFGLAHAVSVAYAVAATVIGLYLGGLFLYADSLTAPIVCHAVYDFVALLWLSRIETSTAIKPG
ncbi:MAG: CPBP family intramembrane metalloprotease [Gammaproteobacteria bacterium]|nr:CPBP family intramembrane metalloprotease [Gammaproteobacteria bacterium]